MKANICSVWDIWSQTATAFQTAAYAVTTDLKCYLPFQQLASFIVIDKGIRVYHRLYPESMSNLAPLAPRSQATLAQDLKSHLIFRLIFCAIQEIFEHFFILNSVYSICSMCAVAQGKNFNMFSFLYSTIQQLHSWWYKTKNATVSLKLLLCNFILF